MPPEKSPKRLGRGLDALFGSHVGSVPRTGQEGGLRNISISTIRPNPYQPRKEFAPNELVELQRSIEAVGLLQPISVRQTESGGYELIAGERRLRAVHNLGWEHVPALVKELDDRQMLAMALVENLQRSDLNTVEEARGYEQLVNEFGLTHQGIGTLVGKDRSTVANALRLLSLPTPILRLLQEGKLTAGQARPLLSVMDERTAVELSKETAEKGLSAREVERRVKDLAGPRKSESSSETLRSSNQPSPAIRDIEERLRRHLQTDVKVVLRTSTRGSITVEFYSPDDLDRITNLLGLSENPH